MHVVVTTIPGLGHLHPMVPLLTALADAGHRVDVVVPPSFVPAVAACGLTAVGLGPDWVEPRIDEVVPGFLDLESPDQHRVLLDLAVGAVPELFDFASGAGADVIIHDHAETAGWIVAERLGIPNVPFAMTARVLDPATMAVMGVLADYDRILVAQGLPAGAGRCTRWLYLDAVPPSFTRGILPAGATVRPVRYEPHDQGGGDLPAWLEHRSTDRPLVYVTLGTIYNKRGDVLARLARGAARLDVDVLVTVGHDGAGLEALPDNVRVEPYVPQSALYPALAAVICHGGFGTVFGALSHGLPLVCAPMSTDQPLNAGLAAAAGAAVNLATTAPAGRLFPVLGPGEPDESAVAAALADVLGDPRFRARATALADEIAAQPAPAAAAAVVEMVVASGRPVSDPAVGGGPQPAAGSSRHSGPRGAPV